MNCLTSRALSPPLYCFCALSGILSRGCRLEFEWNLEHFVSIFNMNLCVRGFFPICYTSDTLINVEVIELKLIYDTDVIVLSCNQ